MWPWSRDLRRLRRAAITPIAELSDKGLFRVSGRAVADDGAQTAPITGSRCAMWQVAIFEWDNGARIPVMEHRSAALISVQDSTGLALVQPEGMERYLRVRHDAGYTGAGEHRREVVAMVRERGLSVIDSMGMLKSFEWHESRIDLGDHLCAMGRVSWILDPSAPAGYREAPRRAVLQGLDGSGVIADVARCKCEVAEEVTAAAPR